MSESAACPICNGMGVRVLETAEGGKIHEPCKCQGTDRRDPTVCPLCDGMGMRLIERKGRPRVAESCECQHVRRVQLLLERAAIPARYAGCSFENFKCDRANGLLAHNFEVAKAFTDIYPSGKEGVGLLFTGSVGTGKTHLATAVLKKLVLEKGVRGLFCDYQELLKQITNSYNAAVKTTEYEVLRPVFEAEVLLLDELGGYRTTEWASDTVAHVLNTRYNSKRVTIITTNFSSDPAGEQGLEGRSPDAAVAASAMRRDTLADRIGERMQSRLRQMCVTLKMHGPDYRDRDRASLQ